MSDPARKAEPAGTIVCGIAASQHGRGAIQLAAAVSERLGLRLVLAHVAGSRGPTGRGGDEGLGAARRRERAGRLLADVASEHRLDAGSVALRVSVGDRAAGLARIAAEEGADLIVLGSRARRLRPRSLRCTLARELEGVTDCPILVAPPPTRRRSDRRLALVGGATER